MGKLENIKYELTRSEINIMIISTTRRSQKDDFYSNEFRILSSGGAERRSVILDIRAAKSVEKVFFEGNRLMLVKL